MQVIKPSTIGLTDGSFARDTTGTYFDAARALQTAAINIPRLNYNRVTGIFEGLLIEPASTNLLLNSATLSTQNVTVTAVTHTISFYGTGSITLSGTATATVAGNANVYVRNTLVFTPSAGTLTVTVSGSVTLAQLEARVTATSYIPTTGTSAARAADVITGTNLLYTNATDPNAVWSSGTTYTLGQKVRYLNIVYESLQNSNLNKTPTTNPTFWLNLGNDNMHAALDTSTSTATSATTELTYIVKVDNPAALAFINVEAAIIEISCTDQTTGEIFYSNTLGLTGENVQDWYQYFFFDPLVKRTQIVITSLGASFLNTVVTVRLRNSVGTQAYLGTLIAGPLTRLGQLQASPTVGIIDYSRKDTDDFGNYTFVQRAFSKRLSAEIFLENTQLNGVQRYLTGLRATPALWIGSDDPQYEETLIVYGFYKDFSTTIAYPQVSMCSLEIEGLT